MSVCKPELSLQYIPSQLKKQKSHGWIIEYYALDGTGSLHRMCSVQIEVQRISG